MSLTRTQRHAATVVLAILSGACAGDPTSPEVGTLRVSIQTLGDDPDLDGYHVVVESSPYPRRQFFGPNVSAPLTGVSTGRSRVMLENVAENCVVAGENPQVVSVIPGEITDVSFTVACEKTGIVVTTRTTGVDVPETYNVVVTGQPLTPVSPNGSIAVSRLRAGTYTVSLIIIGDHCRVAGGSHRTVEVSVRTTTSVPFEVTCGRLVRPETIAYTVDVATAYGPEPWVGVVNPDGTGAVRIARGYSPAWSPDGSRLVFSTTYHDTYYGLPCTGGLVVVDPEMRQTNVLSTARCGMSPAWAPTGDAIAFTRCCEPRDAPPQLYLVTLDGSPAVPLFIPGVLWADAPSWSPDGKRIAFECIVTPMIRSVCIVNRDGTHPVRLTIDDAGATYPTWSPDGNWLAFTRHEATTRIAHIMLLNLQDGSVTRLTAGWDAAWSRDGTRLAFTDVNATYTINLDGSNRTRLTTENFYALAWRP